MFIKNKSIKFVLMLSIFFTSILAYSIPSNAYSYTFESEHRRHNYIFVEKVEATHTTDGFEAHYYCYTCKSYFEASYPYNEVTAASLIIHKLCDSFVYVPRVEPTCTTNGNIAYWYCDECDLYALDEHGNHIISQGDTILDATGHNLTYTPRIEPTCTTEGNIEYWYCSNSNKYFIDMDCINEISFEDTIIEALGHNLTHFIKVEPTCTTNGNIEYWYCSNSNKYFSDMECINEISFEDTIIEALVHNLTHFIKVEPTCTVDGNIEYWYCSNSNKYFSDMDCINEISFEDTIIEALVHNLTRFIKVEPTCTTDGNIEYWYCSNSNKYFSDLECINEISFEDTIIESLGHNLTYFQGNNPTCCKDGNIEYWYCSNCDMYFSDMECMKEITLDDTILLATGHQTTHYESKNPTSKSIGNIEYWYCEQCNQYFLDKDCTIEITFEDTILEKVSTSFVQTNDPLNLSSLIIKLGSIGWFILYQIKRKINK